MAKLPPPRPAVEAPASSSQNGVSAADEVGEPERRDEEHGGAEDGPVAATERRHGEGIGKSHQRGDQPGYRHKLKQLSWYSGNPAAGQFGGDDLQISQTENPMCSAAIDQIQVAAGDGFRPWNSQNVSCSGFQSEIQSGLSSSLEISFSER